MAFVAICTATLADSLTFSTELIDYSQRRVLVQSNLQSAIDEIKAGTLTSLPADSNVNTNFTLPGSRVVTVNKRTTKVVGKNLTLLQMTATWPEVRGTRAFTDTMYFEVYLKGPDA
jgi:hypothetical protein